jgi:hypothetical protein
MDPMATINPLYDEDKEDGHKLVLITKPSLFPSNMLGLHNHIQICNLYTMSPANRKDDEGNPKLQCPTYVVLRVTTKYVFDHIVGLIQSYLTEMNMFVKERRYQALNKDSSGYHKNDCQLVPGISPEDSSQGLGASRGKPTDKWPGGYQILSPWDSCLLALEEQNADAQDEHSHEQAGY